MVTSYIIDIKYDDIIVGSKLKFMFLVKTNMIINCVLAKIFESQSYLDLDSCL